MPLKIGTRGSKLALAQAEKVAAMLQERGIGTEIVVMSTQGDTVDGVPLHEIGGQGVFVRALDDAILAGKIDAAVHSMKDIPSQRPPGLALAAVLKRTLRGLPCASRTARARGTGRDFEHATPCAAPQARPEGRGAEPAGECRHPAPETAEGQFDAVVLAEAGIERLGLKVPGHSSGRDICSGPEPGNDSHCRPGHTSHHRELSMMDDRETRNDILIERTIMEELGGGCFTPMGIYSKGGHVIIEVLSLDGSKGERFETDVADPEAARAFALGIRPQINPLIAEAYVALKLEGGWES
jgi:hydroxymethylbilane synthase